MVTVLVMALVLVSAMAGALAMETAPAKRVGFSLTTKTGALELWSRRDRG
jgi:hypothetical protein